MPTRRKEECSVVKNPDRIYLGEMGLTTLVAFVSTTHDSRFTTHDDLLIIDGDGVPGGV